MYSAKSSPLLPRVITTTFLYKPSMETLFDTSQELQFPIPTIEKLSPTTLPVRGIKELRNGESICHL